MKYFLHVGLHKTATKFYQHRVFPLLPKERVNYNPDRLTQLACDLVKAEARDVPMVLEALKQEKTRLEQDGRDILISREAMSGDLFSFYAGHKATISRLEMGFAGAEVLLSFRFQPDWIVSCYRETVHEHHFQTLSAFLDTTAVTKADGFVHADYKQLDYASVLRTYCERFGSENVHVSFFEDFAADKARAVSELTGILGLDRPPTMKKIVSIPNRGYSALAISVSLWRYRVLKKLGLARFLAHRPIFFFGENGIPAGFENLSVLPTEPYWGKRFLRDGQEVRPASYPQLSFRESLRMALGWRSLMKRGLDRFVYIDFDMLKGRRQELETYFNDKNIGFVEYARKLGVKVPALYLRSRQPG